MTATVGDAIVGGFALRWGSRTDVGNVRALNEDAVLAGPGVFIVADGMGGYEAGEVASQIVIDTFRGLIPGRGDALIRIGEIPSVIDRVNTAILDRGRREERGPLGTTVVGLVIAVGENGPAPVVFHIGDSRCYELRDEVLCRLTADHSEVQELVDAGELSFDEAQVHPARNVITRSLGFEQTAAAEYLVLEPLAARLLLCSDGLTGVLTDADLTLGLSRDVSPQEVADNLVEVALRREARDNISAVVVDLAPSLHSGDDDDTEPRDADTSVWAPTRRQRRTLAASDSAALLEPHERDRD